MGRFAHPRADLYVQCKPRRRAEGRIQNGQPPNNVLQPARGCALQAWAESCMYARSVAHRLRAPHPRRRGRLGPGAPRARKSFGADARARRRRSRIAYMWCAGDPSNDRATKLIADKIERARVLFECAAKSRFVGTPAFSVSPCGSRKHASATFSASTNAGGEDIHTAVVMQKAIRPFHGHEHVPVECFCDCSEACFFPITMALDPVVRSKDSTHCPRTHSACPFPCHHTLALAALCERADAVSVPKEEVDGRWRWMDVGARLSRFHRVHGSVASADMARPLRGKEDIEDMDLRTDAKKWALSHLQQSCKRESVKKPWMFYGVHTDDFGNFGNTPEGVALLKPVTECSSFEDTPVYRYTTHYVNSGKKFNITWLAAVSADGTCTEAAVTKYDWRHFEAPVFWKCSCAESKNKPLEDYEAILAWSEGDRSNKSPAPTPVSCKHVARIIQHAGPFVPCVAPFSSGFPIAGDKIAMVHNSNSKRTYEEAFAVEAIVA